VSRNAQKLVAKDVSSLMSQVKALASSLPKDPTGPLTPDRLTTKTKMQMTKALQGMMKEAQALKRKVRIMRACLPPPAR
jgi:hypothetical protein